MPKELTGVLIDPRDKSIKKVKFERNNLETIYKLLEIDKASRLITCVQAGRNLTLCCDDEGAIRVETIGKGSFKLEYGQIQIQLSKIKNLNFYDSERIYGLGLLCWETDGGNFGDLDNIIIDSLKHVIKFL